LPTNVVFVFGHTAVDIGDGRFFTDAVVSGDGFAVLLIDTARYTPRCIVFGDRLDLDHCPVDFDHPHFARAPTDLVIVIGGDIEIVVGHGMQIAIGIIGIVGLDAVAICNLPGQSTRGRFVGEIITYCFAALGILNNLKIAVDRIVNKLRSGYLIISTRTAAMHR